MGHILNILQLPVDIDEEADDPNLIHIAAQFSPDYPVSPPTSLTIFIHTTRLKMIESEIQHIIYRVDRPNQTTPEIIQSSLDRIAAWEAAIPAEYREKQDALDRPFDGTDVFVRLENCFIF